MSRRIGRGSRGFTLLEVLLAGAIGVMVIAGAYMVYEASQSTFQKSEQKADLQQNARSALDLLTWQIRLAGYLDLRTLPNPIAIGTDTVLVLRGDVQLSGTRVPEDTLFAVQPRATGACPAPPCLVTGTNVYRADAAQVATAFNVAAIRFAYFDWMDNPLAAPLDGVEEGAFADGRTAPSPLPGSTVHRDSVRKVRITLTALDERVSAGPGVGSVPTKLVLMTDVRLRNAN